MKNYKGEIGMKKILKLLLVFFIVFGFTACSNNEEKEPTTIKWGKENKFDGLIAYEIESIGRPKQITPDVIGTVYTYYKPQKDSNVLLDIVLNMKNLTKKDLDIQKSVDASFIIDEEEYVGSIATISEDGTTLKQDGTIAAEMTSKVHLYAEISPEKLNKKIQFKLATKDKENIQEAIMEFKLADINKNYEEKNINDVIKIDGHGEITLQTTNISKELAPGNPDGLYTYYKVNADTNSFVVLTTNIKNTSEKELTASSLVAAKLLDKDQNEYPANIFCENEARDNLTSGGSSVIATQQNMVTHFVFEIPDSLVNEQKTIRISYHGKVFILNF